MSSLIDKLVEQFRSKSQYEHFFQESQQKFDINTYRFQQMTPSMARKAYNQLRQKYGQNTLTHSPRNWHQNQRKTFVWFLLALLKHLSQNHKKIQQQDWQQLSETFFSKDILFLKYQYHTIQKTKRRHEWTQEEDDIMMSRQEDIKHTNWNEIAKEIFFRTRGESYKSSKQCRQRWQNHLDSRIKKQGWQVDQDLTILKYVLQSGKRWSKIVQSLNNTRTQHMVKNRFKSLLSKCESQLKLENKQLSEDENQLIQWIISQLTQHKNAYNPKRQTMQERSQGKDMVLEGMPEIRLNGQPKSYGVLARDENGEFATENASMRSSQALNIFQCRSPAALSVCSNGLVLSHSYNLLTPPAGINPREYLANLNFGTFQQRWNKIQQKASITSEVSNRTTNFIACSRREQNLQFSFQFNNLQYGGIQKTHSQGGMLSTPMIKAIQNHLIFNLTPSQSNALENNSDYYMSTLDSNPVLKEESGKAGENLLKQQHKEE